ncbi:MAG: SDR family oxidoreductase [Gammaproteobacteria bacterium]|nr:SDR family oxidoreductase [Gammaproteobacteria bacterium]
MERVVLIQGASRGIGLQFVRELAQRPDTAKIFATCRRPGDAAELSALAEHYSNIDILTLDVAQETSVAAAAETLAARTDHIDLLINTAGLLHTDSQQPERRLREVNADALRSSFEVNAIGPILMARYFEPFLFRSSHAVFASLSARVGSIGDNRLGGWYAYRASKAAQNMFTRTLAIEWARRTQPVICLALHPGTVDTDLSRPFQKNVTAEKLFSVERAVKQLMSIIDGASEKDTGRFIAWDGQDIPF